MADRLAAPWTYYVMPTALISFVVIGPCLKPRTARLID
jgi:hypothetical protein